MKTETRSVPKQADLIAYLEDKGPQRKYELTKIVSKTVIKSLVKNGRLVKKKSTTPNIAIFGLSSQEKEIETLFERELKPKGRSGQILDYLSQRPYANLRDLNKHLGTESKHTWKNLQQLIKKDFVVTSGTKNIMRYALKENEALINWPDATLENVLNSFEHSTTNEEIAEKFNITISSSNTRLRNLELANLVYSFYPVCYSKEQNRAAIKHRKLYCKTEKLPIFSRNSAVLISNYSHYKQKEILSKFPEALKYMVKLELALLDTNKCEVLTYLAKHNTSDTHEITRNLANFQNPPAETLRLLADTGLVKLNRSTSTKKYTLDEYDAFYINYRERLAFKD